MKLLACSLVVCLACAGPTDSDAPSPADPVEQPDQGADGGPSDQARDIELASGGYVRLERFAGADGQARSTALAELYTGHSGPGRVPSHYYQRFPLDTCFQVPLMPAEPSFYDFVDAGPSIELSGPAVISMPREAVFDNIFYRAAGLEDTLATGVDYAVSSNLVSGSLRMPLEPTIAAPAGFDAGRVELSSEPSIAWESLGADFVFIVLQQGDVGRVCHVTDDGEFTLPEQTNLAIPSWGTIAVVAINRNLVDVGGRPVELMGVHGRSADYERQP